MKRREEREMPEFDVVGVGLNATDTMILIPHFPAYGGKVPFLEKIWSPGGQVASAIVACSVLGLRAKYIGTIGDDERGRIQADSLRGTGVNLDHVQMRKGCSNQSAYILIDQTTGERTVFWNRPDCLRRVRDVGVEVTQPGAPPSSPRSGC
jgi:sulfofructose kinase